MKWNHTLSPPPRILGEKSQDSSHLNLKGKNMRKQSIIDDQGKPNEQLWVGDKQ